MKHLKQALFVNSKGKFFKKRKGRMRYCSFEGARIYLEDRGLSGTDIAAELDKFGLDFVEELWYGSGL